MKSSSWKKWNGWKASWMIWSSKCSWLEEWEKFTNSAPEPGEREIRKWVETQLGKLKGFEVLDQLEQNQIASLYQDALLFSREILSRKEQLGGTLTDEERDVLNYIQNSIR